MPIESGKSVVLDFTNVREQSGYNPKHQEPGDYRAIVKDAEWGESKAGNQQVIYAIADADQPSAVYRYNCVFTENSLWKLRNLFVAAGVNIPKKKIKLTSETLNKVIGKEVGMSLDDDEYEGKVRSKIVGVFPASDLAEDEPEEKPAKKPAKKAKPEPETSDDDDAEEDLDELDIDDL